MFQKYSPKARAHSRAIDKARLSCRPDINRGKQEEPDNVHKVPVPGRSFEAGVLFRREVAAHRTQQTNSKEVGSDHNVQTVEHGRQDEVRAVDFTAFTEAKGGVRILICLQQGEERTESNRNREAIDDVLTVVFMDQRVVRPCRCTTRAKQNQRVDQRQVPWVECFDTQWPNRQQQAKVAPSGKVRS